ncbi:NAD(P)/FAD-dependent oxidoreductase [Chelatococcus asaccharovorans]|uniref:NADPH-dependent 2,4-dienoyl-CoA reductase/sulfur reductase-like enzyme n=1 Tax=Chelatococcus asaccharovorans TaxID=28210 RepID=A0A2V3U8P9_9HYPH|nr:NAD(P)/FAD-dependent oxidoreductase [Chelatococcus asaccharovorans]MBS7707457.1 FAD-dependent oxidoreductase [Chelatococcus asaccharovorans]PXW54223.1 NADPH-dependent 2,4-dienoyl-CoA reductase/sulfur reductase-like enzyme [Chelatococcus asaccharovorans]
MSGDSDKPRIAIVGAGPAGTRAAEVLVAAGLRPVVIDEAAANGGRIYQRQPPGFSRSPEMLYGFEAKKARAVHGAFDRLAGAIDYRPGALVWNIGQGALDLMRDGDYDRLAYDRLILATGAMDRVIPLPGWTLPGVTTLGGAQVALKAQGVGIGQRVAFVGTGPLLFLVAYQYAKAGATVALVLDTATFADKASATLGLMNAPKTFAKGIYYYGWLKSHGVRLVEGAMPRTINGEGGVTALTWRDASGADRATACDAVALGWGLKPETQLADLAGVPFAYSERQRGWLPEVDAAGRTPLGTVYMAGDGVRIGGADVAELAGARAAWSLVEDIGIAVDKTEIARIDRALAREDRFRRAVERAGPFPVALAAGIADETVLCRCERITAGELRAAAREEVRLAAPEVNRAKAFTRVGMGRCQGRVCGPAAAEILAAALGSPLPEVGRLRGQAPVKPIPIRADAALVPEAKAS